MGERWVTLLVGEDETLRGTSCSKYLHDQMGYLDVDDRINEAMCGYCWKEDQKEETK